MKNSKQRARGIAFPYQCTTDHPIYVKLSGYATQTGRSGSGTANRYNRSMNLIYACYGYRIIFLGFNWFTPR